MRRTAVWLAFATLALYCLPAHAIVLRYSPKKGQVAKHKMTLSGTTSMVMSGAEGMTMKMAMTGSVNTTEKVLSTTAETATVETKITGGKVTMKMGGEGQSVDIPQGRVVAEMDDRGRMVKMIENDMGEGMEGMMGGPLDFSDVSEFGAAFPEGDVKINGTWSGQMQFPLGEGQEISISANSRLLELLTYQGRKCAKIRSSFKGPLSIDLAAMGMPAEEGGGTMSGTLTGQMVMYYDYVNSVYVSGEGTVGMNMKFAASDPEMGPMTMNMKMDMKIKMSLVK